MDRYKNLIDPNDQSSFKAIYAHDSANHAQTALTQAAVQDVFFSAQDVVKIRDTEVRVRFLHVHQDPDHASSDKLFYAIVQVPYADTYDMSYKRLVKPGNSARLAFAPAAPASNRVLHVADSFEADDDFRNKAFIAFDPNLHVAKRRVAAINQLFDYGDLEASRVAPKLVAPVTQAVNVRVICDDDDCDDDDYDDGENMQNKETAPLEDDPAVVYNRLLLNSYLKDFVIGRGFPTVLHPSVSEMQTDIADLKNLTATLTLSSMAPTSPDSLLPPRIDYIGDGDLGSVNKILEEMDYQTRDRFVDYLQHVVLGMLGVAGFAGSGKTHHLALCALLMLAHPNINRIYVSAPTHMAVSNIAERINKLGIKVHGGTSAGVPLVVRGLDMKVELENFMSTIQPKAAKEDEWRSTGYWEQPLSLCEWLLKVVRAPGYELAAQVKPGLHDISQRFLESDYYSDLRLLVAGEHVPDAEDGKPSHRSKFRNLMITILATADFVCTTPYASKSKPYRSFAAAADAVVLDEAGCMCLADAIMVWGTQCRPCAMAGDVRQFPPAVMDRDRNRFYDQAAVSVLDHFQKTSNPTFVLNRQMRIFEGLFNLAREIIYHDVPDITYGEMVRVGNHPVARRIDAWAGDRYGYRPRPDRILPVFLHCDNTVCEMAGASRVNRLQNAAAVSFIDALVSSGVALASQIVVISPYRANVKELADVIAKRATLANVAVSSTDSFQGRESLISILVTCVTAETGPLFVANMSRMCVAITRHVGGLFVVGDVNTVGCDKRTAKPNMAQGAQDTAEEDGVKMTTNMKMFKNFLGYFKQHKRVVDFPMSGLLSVAKAQTFEANTQDMAEGNKVLLVGTLGWRGMEGEFVEW
ncbi:hypothetical protein SCUCBS95973_005994 [Sporothrix curviconia]|uniref:DNA2/NAM7 helicase-like C-terminal domain-containing protein n=1 Tax=Sporothrix curviconia TaxID=1260050 RepID=A0ABP0C1X6_9PEZI